MKILVIGGAVSGTAAAELARRHGHDVAVYDTSAAAVAGLRDEAFVIHSGAWADHLLRDVDVVVTSPGVPEHAKPIQDALGRGVTVWSELEWGARHLDCPYTAITGTNGKSTVTAVTARMLDLAGRSAPAGGNLGTPVSALALEHSDEVVLEASSFQLRFIDQFRPAAAAITNVAPDHLDWHGDEQRYADAKARIFEHLGPDDALVYDADDPGAASLVRRASARLVPVSGLRMIDERNGFDGTDIVVDGNRFGVPHAGAGYRVDLAIAAALAIERGCPTDAVAKGIEEFTPSAHRRAVVGTWDGITWINDSKATNPHAAVAAAEAYPNVVLIAGGRNKGLDLSGLTRAPTVRVVVAYGEAADELQAAAPARVVVVPDIPTAVSVADEHAEPGDTVLLAPGCASFDQFTSYAARGEAFEAAVVALKGGAR